MKIKTYKVVTLGCRTNQYESQAYVDQLALAGYREVRAGEKATVGIVNTCTVTESADKRSLYQIRKMMREHRPGKLVVTGCLAERMKKELETYEGITDIVANANKETLLQDLFPENEWPEFRIRQFEAHTRAFVKIQDGCNSYCSYCIIPFVRGRSRSKKVEVILSEIEGLVENGYREVVLTGINIGDFDGGTPENPTRLCELVRLVDQIPGLERVRISSIDPDEVDDSLLSAVIEGKKTCPSMHIVLQSGSNLTLKRMRRKYTRQDFVYAIDRLKKACSDFTFTTDVIVGFPGETDEDFNETVHMVEKVRFAKVHLFPYSDRPKTRASRLPNKVSEKIMEKRRKILSKVAEEVASDLRSEYVGRTLSVLLESEQGEDWIMGHTAHFLPVLLPKQGLRSNEIVQVDCVQNGKQGLIGKKVEVYAGCL